MNTLAGGTIEQKVARLLKHVTQGFDPLIASAVALYKLQAAPPNPQDGWLWFLKSTNRFQARLLSNTMTVPLVVSRSTSTVTVGNTTDATAIVSFTVPANLLGTDRILRVQAFAAYTNNSSVDRTLVVSIGYGGTAWTDTSIAIPTSASVRPMMFTASLAPQNGSTSAQRLLGEVSIGTAGGGTSGQGDFAAAELQRTTYQRNPSIDSTADQTFAITITHSAADANLSISRWNYVAEIL